MATSDSANPDAATGRVPLELSPDAALVLFELLARADADGLLAGLEPAEQRVLWDMEAQLEKRLTAPFRADYRDVLTAARARVAAPNP